MLRNKKNSPFFFHQRIYISAHEKKKGKFQLPKINTKQLVVCALKIN